MYCTIEDLKNQVPENILIELTDDQNLGTVDTSKIDSSISDATAEIEAYAQARYAVPFNPVPDMIRKISVDITLYNLFCRRGFDAESADAIISQRYKAAIKFLENVAKGVVEITPKGSLVKPDQQGATFQSPPRQFTRDKMRDF